MTDTIYAALAAANRKLTNPRTDSSATSAKYSYTYATLDAVLGHVRPVLAEQGVFVFQDVTNTENVVQIVTTLAHESGDTISFGPLQWPNTPNPQHLGGLISYGRRYALLAALGIAAGDDDDAQEATHAGSSGSRAVRAEARATEKQVQYLAKLMREAGTNEAVLSDFAKDTFGWELPTEGLAHLSATHASDLIDAMSKRVKAEGAKVTRTKVTTPPTDDPWQAPLVDPTTGEVAK
jgi:ERF superfamily